MEATKPSVSIIMPCYNAERFIAESIQSVISQDFQSWELLITDDCSNDHTVDIIKHFCENDDRIKLFVLSTNSGPGIARNNSITYATGKYIAFLDSDDMWMPNKLSQQIHFMQEFGYPFTFTSYKIINENGCGNKTIHVPKSLTYKDYLKNTIIGCLTVMINRDIVGDFRMPDIRTSQDMATWLDIMKSGHIAYGLDEVLSLYRTVSNSNTHNKVKAAKQVWKVYREIEQLSIPKSLYFFFGYAYNAVKKRLLN